MPELDSKKTQPLLPSRSTKGRFPFLIPHSSPGPREEGKLPPVT